MSLLINLNLTNHSLALTLYSEKMSGNYSELILSSLTFVIMSIFIIALAFLTTRFLSFKIKAVNNSKNIKLIEKVVIGVDKSLFLVQLDKYYYLLFINKNGIQLIDKTDSLQLIESNQDTNSFSDILNKFKKK